MKNQQSRQRSASASSTRSKRTSAAQPGRMSSSARFSSTEKRDGKRFSAPQSRTTSSRPGLKQAHVSTTKFFSTLVLKQVPTKDANVEPLAALPYKEELSVKNAALKEFWSNHRLEGFPMQVVASPKARHYRTTTKRAVVVTKSGVQFGFGDKRSIAKIVSSVLEPKEHQEIYEGIYTILAEARNLPVAQVMNYVIIRGSYTEFSIILNVAFMHGELIRSLKFIAQRIKETLPMVVSCYVYHDSSRSEYYLDSKPLAGKGLRTKTMYGHDTLRVNVADTEYIFYPNCFSQVNQSIVPEVVRFVSAAVLAEEPKRVLDLYCGYGLFAFALAGKVPEILGIDAEGASIRSAVEMAKRSKKKRSLKFLAKDISETLIEEYLPPAVPNEVLILDPPRNGTDKGVIRALAERNPKAVVHIFCSVDEIPKAMQEWKRNKYFPHSIVPFDMFPGTPALEVAVVLKPSRL